MKRICCLLLLGAACSAWLRAESSTPEKPTLASRTAGLTRHDGFLPYYQDDAKGEFLFQLSPASLSHEFLYFTGLGTGIGSIEMFADRSSFSGAKLCRFRRLGMRVLVIEENTGFRADNGSSELKHSVQESFPTSVLASLPIEAEQDGTVLVNANSLLIRDAADLLSQLRHPTRAVGGVMIRDQSGSSASWRLEESRSAVDPEHSGNFPLNTEVEVLLTFTSDAESELNQPDAHALSLREHHSFLTLPAPGYQVREHDPRIGFFGPDFEDFSQPYDQPLARELVNRWRLQKKDPSAPLSEPVKPIVFYLDQAMPEPVRSAAKRGALWWNAAFWQAGFKNAVQVEDLPAGADPMDIRYTTIQWTNRSGRGWSVGQTHADPRTGEILHAVVQLDSHRQRTANNLWQATVPPGKSTSDADLDMFAGLDNADPQLSDQQVMLNRIALLTCHEVGHALGLAHNFVASTFARGSVMDYFAPRISIRPDGTADLSDAYMQGVGTYDKFAIEWGYGQGPANATADQERARLDGIVRKANALGIVWGNFDDPRWNAYDDGPDPVTWLRQVLPVRDALLANFGPQMLRPGEPNSALTARFPLVYLFHRYALAAAANVVGSATVPLGLHGDGLPPVVVWPAQQQKAAVQLMLEALQPAKLTVSPELWKALPPSENQDPSPERFTSSAGYLFSPHDGARAVAEIVVGGLLEPRRLQRLEVLANQDSQALSPDSLITQMVNATFASSGGNDSERSLAGVVQSEVAERLMLLAVNPEATPEVKASALRGVLAAQQSIKKSAGTAMLQQLDHEIALFLQNPSQNTPKLKASGAPPGPPI